MIRTLQGAWWLTLLGTEPSRKRLAPVMPLLPTTMRSAPCSSATSRIASAGSPWRAKVRVAAPCPSATSTATASVASTSSRGLSIQRTSSGAWEASSRSRVPLTGSKAETISNVASTDAASSAACPTALPAVSDPSVPTTIVRNLAGRLRASDELDRRDDHARQHAHDDEGLHPDPERAHCPTG